ncbi:MAG: hypothetical protein KBE42_07980 [Steroidobacteraceae bacterium]|nr:hypothetical protein [Steroidobacteraceae bacterium]
MTSRQDETQWHGARLLAGLLVVAAVLLVGAWWRSGRPVDLADAPAGRLQCVSYAASGSADAPSEVTLEHLRRDLALLATRFRCVRTYTVSHGMDQVPAVARELGLEVLLGIWIGRDAAHNEREIDLAIAAARANRDVVRAIVVGNEVLLRHEQSPGQLAGFIRHVQHETGMPVTYADVWEFWLKHRELAGAVSFVTVHILPYWDDAPVAIDEVVPHVGQLYRQMRAAFPGKAVLVGETGWPSAGRPRGGSVPGRVNQARYHREFAAYADSQGIPYNLIEAFDQPWKRMSEGTVGGHWGLHDVHGVAKFPWAGPMIERPEGRRVAILASAAGVATAVVALLVTGGVRIRRAAVAAAGAAMTMAIGAHQWSYLSDGNITIVDWSATLLVAGIGWILFVRALQALVAWPATDDPIPRTLGLALLGSAVYVCLGLVLAGRHRDFPVWLFLPGVIAFVLAAALDLRVRARALLDRRAVEETTLATCLLVAGTAIPLLEGLDNLRSLAWGASTVALGLSILLPLALESRANEHAADHACP